MRVPKQRPGQPGPGARARTPPPQGLGNGSDAAQAIPESAGHLGALKGTPGRLRPIDMCHTSPTTPKTLNITRFGFASPQGLPRSLKHIPNCLYCAQVASPMQVTSEKPQETRHERRASESDWSGRSRSTGKRRYKYDSFLKFSAHRPPFQRI